MDTAPVHLGFVPGVTPDKWARTWAQLHPGDPLRLVPLDGPDPVGLLRAGDLQMCLLRLPVDREGLHVVPLYDEMPVVVVAREHPAAAYDEIDVADLLDEHLLQDPDDVPAWRDLSTEVARGTRHPVPPMSLRAAVATVAAGTGVIVVPMSVARLHHRRDVVSVPVLGVPTTTVALAWPRDLEDPRLQEVVGVVRGRTANSSRGTGTDAGAPTSNTGKTTAGKTSAGKTSAGKTSAGKASAGRTGTGKKGSGKNGSGRKGSGRNGSGRTGGAGTGDGVRSRRHRPR